MRHTIHISELIRRDICTREEVVLYALVPTVQPDVEGAGRYIDLGVIITVSPTSVAALVEPQALLSEANRHQVQLGMTVSQDVVAAARLFGDMAGEDGIAA